MSDQAPDHPLATAAPAPAPGRDDPLALAEYAPGASAVLTDPERWPTADGPAFSRLARWRDHPQAPAWTHATGDRLDAEAVERSRHPLPLDAWLVDHLETARGLRRYRGIRPLERLDDFPSSRRTDLERDLAAFVPPGADLGAMLHGTSSGSTGASLVIPDHVEEVARGFHLLVELARAAGADWRPDGERMALVHVVAQRQAFTYVSLVSGFAHRAMARVNLAAGAWRSDADRAAFLADAAPQVVTGSPAGLGALLDGSIRESVHPLAILSSAMALSAPLRADLEAAFACPVIDVYGLHETRPIAARSDDGPFVVLDRRVVVETLGDGDLPVPDGEVGEIAVTAGENPLLPLVRYRTGDVGRLVDLPGGRVGIADLEGRAHTRFVAGDGRHVETVELTQQLQAAGVRGWSVSQSAAGDVSAVLAGGDPEGARRALALLLARPVTVRMVRAVADLGDGKPRRYRSDAVTPAAERGPPRR